MYSCEHISTVVSCVDVKYYLAFCRWIEWKWVLKLWVPSGRPLVTKERSCPESVSVPPSQTSRLDHPARSNCHSQRRRPSQVRCSQSFVLCFFNVFSHIGRMSDILLFSVIGCCIFPLSQTTVTLWGFCDCWEIFVTRSLCSQPQLCLALLKSRIHFLHPSIKYHGLVQCWSWSHICIYAIKGLHLRSHLWLG